MPDFMRRPDAAQLEFTMFWKRRAKENSAPLPGIRYDDNGDERVIFTLPRTKRPDMPSVLLFALPKSGSTLLDRMIREASAEAGLTYVSIMEEFFKLGIPDNLIPPSTSEIFLDKGYCYGGFRNFPRRFEIPILAGAKKVLLVRDPRDMLVSHYYSMKTSHPERGKVLKSSTTKMRMRDLAQEMDIDTYVIEAAKGFMTYMNDYVDVCRKHDIKIYRYEDVIYEKKAWLADICQYMGWTVSDRVIAKIVAKHDQIPTAENESQHIRQVHPGNYKTKLKPETIKVLTDTFAGPMQVFGYA